MSEPDWTPQEQEGGVYCSPACGCRCTKADFDRATLDAKTLALRMGTGWEPHVWENGGWHWKIRRGAAEIRLYRSYQRGEIYVVNINSAHQFIGDGATPEEALIKAIKSASETVGQIVSDVAAIKWWA